MTGVLIGSYIFGDMSDRFGRRPTFFISLVLQLIGGLLAAIAPEYVTFVLARIIIGATTSGVFLIAYVIGTFYFILTDFYLLKFFTYQCLNF